jgi:acetylornithine deacetylase
MDLFAFARELIDLDSTTGKERALGDFLYSALEIRARARGGAVERMPVAEDRFNVFAAWGEPAVVISTHFDTVPPFFPSSEDEDLIHGRGACDTKGGIAAMFAALDALLAAGRRGFGILLVVGEETDSLGAQVANEQPRGARYLINGEPTENRLALGSKGALYLDIEAEGKAAHSAYPELGDSAVDRLLASLSRVRAVHLPADPILGETTLNIGTLSGGRAPNVIADRARAEVMVRTVGPSAELLSALREAIEGGRSGAGGAGVRIAAWRETPAIFLGALPGFATCVVKYTTDIPRLSRWGEPFLLGPGSIHVAHTPHERVAKRELIQAAELYSTLVETLLDR